MTRLFADALPPSAVPGLSFPAFPSLPAAQAIALLAQLEATQWWSPAALREAQLAQLDALLRHARGAPYAAGWRDDGPLTWARWTELPILRRATVQRAPHTLAVPPPPSHGPASVARTSGSTSEPIEVPRTAVAGLIWHALAMRDHLWHGRDPRAGLAAIRHAPGAERGVTFAEWGPVPAALGLRGPLHVLHVRATTREQLAWMAGLRAQHLLVYPSTLRDLVEAAPRCPLPELRSVLTFGEVCEPALRARVREAWGVPIQDSYSAEEVGYLALQCPGHEHLHVQPESALVEIVRPDGSPCGVGEIGEVLVTPLHGFAMPLLRYALGDRAAWGPPCPCGRGAPVLATVQGRVHETFVTASGDRIWLTIGVHQLPSVAPVAQHQLVQERPGAVELRLVARRPPTEAETTAVHALVAPRLPAGSSLTVRWVDTIERAPSGKFLSFVSRLPTSSA